MSPMTLYWLFSALLQRSQAGRHPEPLFAGVCFPPGRISGAAPGRDGGRSGSRLRALRVHHPARRTSWGRPSSRFPPRSDPRDLRTASRRWEVGAELRAPGEARAVRPLGHSLRLAGAGWRGFELLPLQMLLLPPRPPHPRSSSPETMDPPPPKAPPFPKTEGPSSTPSSAAGPRPPRLGRHLLIDANGVPYTYTVQLEEEPRGPPQCEAPTGEPGPRKGYSCPECARVFASPLRLQSHRVSHSDLKPFTCGACGKAFKRSSHLSRHRATHRARAGPPHTCPLCPRRFQDAAELAQHVRLH
ncbi:zinc finger protein 580 isoform X1 [Neophocaena asiaeorientalis asiaeorientalis]|uniref:Zinc finger protein 580 n=1 Tax=Neophocaena asiaeorientalis asiaeorientalis TaxID=1706337 RepID=A0A341CAI6_NEOAA|nr:zinc finger protein 580 isoform X1 [Neophocaena asiaeorientalis asiaeorientalis]